MLPAYSLARAGRWFLESGIQEPSGGVARFYRSEVPANRAVSTEITGYVASTYAWLFEVTGEQVYLDRAILTANYLVHQAWDPQLRTFPFELPAEFTYFFDCGIIIRGLLAVWRITGDERLLAVASEAAHGMVRDFRADGDYHPILTLPGKQPVERTLQWSRGPGCYQLKSALAWFDVAQITGDADLAEAWEGVLASSLETYQWFLPETTDSVTCYAVMDRLHACSYFLEALRVVLDRPECARAYRFALASVERHLREISPFFARSDVYAQLLRARINGTAAVTLDPVSAAVEAEALARFQMSGSDLRADPRIDGGFTFGCRDGVLSPHINPVSTAFAIQALEMWRNPQCPSIII